MTVRETYSFVLESLYDGECPGIMYILHDDPVNCLLVLPVHPCRLDELGLDAGNGVRLLVRVEVDSEGVDHLGGVCLRYFDVN